MTAPSPAPEAAPPSDRIVSDPAICGGSPCVHGTRILAASIRAFTNAGYSETEIIAEYPGLTPDDIEAALKSGAI